MEIFVCVPRHALAKHSLTTPASTRFMLSDLLREMETNLTRRGFLILPFLTLLHGKAQHTTLPFTLLSFSQPLTYAPGWHGDTIQFGVLPAAYQFTFPTPPAWRHDLPRHAHFIIWKDAQTLRVNPPSSDPGASCQTRSGSASKNDTRITSPSPRLNALPTPFKAPTPRRKENASSSPHPSTSHHTPHQTQPRPCLPQHPHPHH